MRPFFAALALTAMLAAPALAGRPPATRDRVGGLPPVLSVNGDAESPAKPDLAIVRMGAEEQADKAQAAQDAVNQTMTKATKAIRDLGIAEEDIQTSGLNLYPVYGQPDRRAAERGEQGKLIGYRAGNVLEISVSDLSKVGPVIDAAIAQGANRMEGVNFSLKDDLEPRKKALAAAANEARAKADALAAAMGVTIEGVEEVAEGGVQVYPVAMRRMAAYAAGAEAMAATPVQPGEVRVHASVTVTYRIAPADAPKE